MKSFTQKATKLNNRFYYLLISLLLTFSGYSQNVGINATGAQPNASAGLDIDFPNKGLLIPRVALTSTTSFAPLAAHVAGMVVYNTATAGDVTPGFYYDNGLKWIPGFLKGQSVGDMLYWSGTEWLRIPIGVPGQYLQISGGFVPTWGGNVYSMLTTTAASAITTTTATSGGNVISDGGSAVISRGVCWNTTGAPTIANSKTTDASGTGIFSSSLTGLLSGTTYHVRSYAINSTVVNYGNEITFTTLANIPTLAATTAASSITGNSANTGGNITADGGAPILERGVCYATTQNPTIAATKVIDPFTTTGSFVSNLTGLLGGTLYYVRAYATNSQGTAYGTQISFTTTVIPPTLVTAAATNISGASATSGASMNWNGGGYSNYQAYGVAYSTTPGSATPTKVATNSSNYSVNPAVNIAPWVTNITGLAANTTYYIRSYLDVYRSGWITVYGNELSFTTTAPTAPIVGTTTAATLVTGNTARTGGAIISDGGSAVTAKGVCWGTTPNPTIGVGNFSTDGTGSAAFTSNLTGLNGSTNYYVRAYATNAIGTSYSTTDVTFTTTHASLYTIGQNVGYGWVVYIDPLTGGGFIVSSDIASTNPWGCTGTSIATGTLLGTGQANTNLILATCATRPIAASIADDYTGGGFTDWYLPSSGEMAKIGAIASQIGIGSSTNNYYTSSQANANSAASWFTNFSSGYASSASKSAGTGSYVSYLRVIRDFAGPAAVAPTLASTVAITNITATTATSGGIIASDGGAAITAKGVCWSTSASPTIVNSKTIDGTGTATFASSITGLTTGTPYYVRAYATNSAGTSYGPEITFTPVAPGFPNVTTTAITNILATSATSGGNVISDGGGAITARGVCWSTITGPTIADSKTTNGTGTGTFVSSITGLTTGLTYYVRAYATNATGTSYGAEYTVTPITLATVSTDAITNIDATSATSGGNITNNGGSAVTARGVCWNTVTGPTIADSKTTDGTGSGTFVSSITGLTNGVTYYVKAYATNGAGTAYGSEVSFTASGPGLPTVTTVNIVNQSGTETTIAVGGEVTSDGGSPVTARGVVYSSTSYPPTLLDPHTSNGTGTGTFTGNISGLIPGNFYTIIAYATNSYGTAYGTETYYMPVGLPTVTTGQLSYTAPETFAQLPVYVSNLGGGSLSAYGVVWGTSPNPTVTTNLGKTTEDLANYFMYQNTFISPLSQSTTYYVRGYATTENGTAYGTEISFTPGVAGLPTVETVQIINKVGSLAEGEGNILSDGGDAIITGGLCWAATANPTVDANLGLTTDGFSGQFFSPITGLTVGTTYHVRAYATNAIGTAYGADLSFVATAAYIGQVIQGGYINGKVFSIDGTGNHGLIADPWGWGVEADWGCGTNLIGTSTAVGAGLANTQAIIADNATNNCVSSSTYNAYAAELTSWNGTGFHLPSKGEFDILWANKDAAGIPLASATVQKFWSSSEADATNVWYFDAETDPQNPVWVNTGSKSAMYTPWSIMGF